MGTDRYAYQSRLRNVDPIPKLCLAAAALLACIFCDSVAVGLCTLLVMGVLTVALGAHRPGVFLHFLKIPLAFILIGAVTILLRPLPEETAALWSGWLFGRFRWGITADSLHLSLVVFCKAMGAISAMYFLSLNTAMTDFTAALERLRVPKLMVELMELIYRFIFVLSETAGRIRVAQESRLGYVDFPTSIRSTGTLASMVFLRAWRKSDRVYAALESRGYSGSLTTLRGSCGKGLWLYGMTGGVVALQLGALLLERRFFP